MDTSFWEQAEVVRSFAERAPDVRLVSLLESGVLAERRRVLDVGCAGGRNTVFLAQHGFDVQAVDASSAMVAETRRRLAAVLGEERAEERVQHGRMDDLGRFPDGYFDLVLAIGIWHAAASWAEWERAVKQAVRVLAPGGRLLLSQFTPATDLTGRGIQPVSGEPHTYDGFESGRAVLLDLPDMGRELGRLGLVPVRPLEVLTTEQDGGRRVSVTGEVWRSGPAPTGALYQ